MIGVPLDHTVTENKRGSLALGKTTNVSPAHENEWLLILSVDVQVGHLLDQ